MQMDKKTKIIILSVVAVVIVALVIVLSIVLSSNKDNGGSDATSSNKTTAQVVSIDENAYNQQVSLMTPTDAVLLVGKWVLTGIQTAEGGNADVVAVIGREILTTDTMQFQADGSFSNYIGGLENKDITAITGLYTVNGADVVLTYGNGKTAKATFDSAKQILTVNDGAYSYTLLRAF